MQDLYMQAGQTRKNVVMFLHLVPSGSETSYILAHLYWHIHIGSYILGQRHNKCGQATKGRLVMQAEQAPASHGRMLGAFD